jgi:hypothetical protein
MLRVPALAPMAMLGLARFVAQFLIPYFGQPLERQNTPAGIAIFLWHLS